MTVTHIDTAPDAIRNQYNTKRYSQSTYASAHGETVVRTSLPGGYLASLAYAKTCQFDVDRYEPVFLPIRERLRGDTRALTAFSTTYADDLRLEAECERVWQAQRAWAESAPSYTERVAANQAAYQAEQLEHAINDRAVELMRSRELAVRAQAFADARQEISR
jgi:hypothetical protein